MSGDVFPNAQRHSDAGRVPPAETDRLIDQRPGNAALVGGRYELTGQIGEGGMSRVYQARDRVLDRVVAVKLLREEYGSDPGFVARFYREARAAASLAHPNIVDIYDYGPHNDTYFITMQHIEGTDLKSILRREGALPVRRAVEIVDQVLRALTAAHERGIIHRDVKPQNILARASDGAIKLTDFGVARALDGADLTTTGAALGTAHYMAPEQGSGGAIGPATDVYATGVVLYELLSGNLPFRGANQMQIMLQHLHSPPPPLSESAPGVSPALERVVGRALAKDPAQRFRSAEEMRHALAATVGGGTPAALGTVSAGAAAATTRVIAPPSGGRPAVRRRSALLLPALLGALLLCGLLSFVGLNRAFNTDGASLGNPTSGIVAPSTAPPSPTVTEAPAVVPTATPMPPTPTATSEPPTPTATVAPPTPTKPAPTATPTPAPPPSNAAPPTFDFRPAMLQGAYRRDDGTLYGRQTAALYGAGTGHNEGTFNFQVARVPSGAVTLVLTGIDDERPQHCSFEVIVNGHVVFNGANTFPNAPTNDNGVGGPDRHWGQMRIQVPANVFTQGVNTMTLRNNTPGSQLGIPYILINDVDFVAD